MWTMHMIEIPAVCVKDRDIHVQWLGRAKAISSGIKCR